MQSNRPCPICSTSHEEASLFLDENIDTSLLSNFSFSSRKVPEYMCHRLVRCPKCDLIYADQPPDETALAEAYHCAEFGSTIEADDAALAYERAIVSTVNRLYPKKAALEIGTGTGAFLEVLKRHGFESVIGIEPSAAAINAAPTHRKAWIIEDIFHENSFQPSSFDLICCFMTLEHVRNPHHLVSSASRLLRPGGAIALVTHNYRSPINRILGRRSPIIDIEHMQLFSPTSLRHLLELNKFESIEINSFKNTYTLQYWLRLLPFSPALKRTALKLLTAIGAEQIKVGINVGNILSIAFRPK